MARVPVTYEQVEAVANALVAQGIKDPGTKAIREELAKRAGTGRTTGSPNTIQRHLNEWRLKARPIESADVPQLPPQLAGDIARALNAAATVAREKVEERLTQVQAELDELASTGEVNEGRIEEMTQELAARTSERDLMAGQLAERTTELEGVKAALAVLQERHIGVEQELNFAKTAAQEANARVDEGRQATERQLAKMQAELDQARAAQAAAERRATDAEKDAAATEAHLKGEQNARKLLEANGAELMSTVKRLEADATKAHAAEATAGVLRDQLADAKATIAMMQRLLDPMTKK